MDNGSFAIFWGLANGAIDFLIGGLYGIVLGLLIVFEKKPMPDGRTHSTATIFLAAGLGAAAYYHGWPIAPLIGGALAGLVLTPDLDVRGGSISNHLVRRSAGCLVGGIWRLFWLPYSHFFHHRSALTHFPVISTAIRLLYLFGIPLLIWYLVKGVLLLPALPWWGIWAVYGLMAADGIHWVLDHTIKPI